MCPSPAPTEADAMEVGPRLSRALEGRYTVERLLGTGGMATVWKARDERHHRPVAIKVLAETVSRAVGSERFLREIRITAALNHPHVVPLLDSGEADGLLYAVMPLIAGESLRGLLNRQERLPLEQAVQVVGQVGAALDHAHRQEVVHRDIKPENILFSEGLAVVSDFGIARAMSLAGPHNLTRTGFGVGTLGYMSPEQAAGREDIDARADVFGLAVVAYEMLVGALPGGWMTDDAVRVGRYLDAPDEHRALLDTFPGRVEQTLVKGLAVRPADRHETPGDLARSLAEAAEGSRALSEAQVQEVLRRATELELEEETAEPSALTLGSLEQVAAEVGIAPSTVRRAVGEVVGGGPPSVPAPGKKKSDHLVAHRVARAEMEPEDHEALVGLIQDRLGIAGHVTVLGRTLTWSPANPGDDARKIVVTVRAEEGRTQIHCEERLELSGWRMMIPAWGAGTGLVTMLVLLLLLGLDLDTFFPLIVAGGAVGGGTGVWTYFRVTSGSREPELVQLVDALQSALEARHPPGDAGTPPRLAP
jgi:tRNA A-37 threonylcarbamoyl transferase component Bud32/AraC-like DNA-binding protein